MLKKLSENSLRTQIKKWRWESNYLLGAKSVETHFLTQKVKMFINKFSSH